MQLVTDNTMVMHYVNKRGHTLHTPPTPYYGPLGMELPSSDLPTSDPHFNGRELLSGPSEQTAHTHAPSGP